MTEAIKAWLMGVVAAAMCLSLLEAMVPHGVMREIAGMSGGLILLLVMVQPWTQIEPVDWTWSYADYELQLNRQIGEYRESCQQQMARIIEQESAAYISKKAEEIGAPCRVTVTTRQENGVPVPSSVTLETPKDEVLAVWITQEFAIDEAQQYWEAEE